MFELLFNPIDGNFNNKSNTNLIIIICEPE